MSATKCIVCITIVWAFFSGVPAIATVDGPDLAEALGWDPSSREAYFAIHHMDETGRAATVVRLQLDGPDTARCQPLWWTKNTYADSTYKARWERLTQKLVPLKEYMSATVPGWVEIVSLDTVVTKWHGPYARYRVRGRFGGHEGTIEAVTYVDPAVRMVRHYYVSELGVSIGLFSFIGKPYEGAYEVQLPALIPSARGSRVQLEWVRGW